MLGWGPDILTASPLQARVLGQVARRAIEVRRRADEHLAIQTGQAAGLAAAAALIRAMPRR